MSLFADIFADIGDEQSIEQSLSTFSGHITNITRILKQAHSNSLVLLDELGAGTDPQEGSALARAILSHLVTQRIPCLIATHYPELKAFAHSTPGVVNASMEFNLRTLRPTYHLTIGLPGRSNALAIADRLGLPKEITDSARTMLNPDDLRVEGLLDEIHRQRDLARRARDASEEARREAERIRRELAVRLDKVEEERRKILEQARADAEKESAELRAELDDVRRALARARQPLDALKPLQDQVADLQAQAERPVERQRPDTGDGVVLRPLRVGEKVRLLSLRMDGIVTSLSTEEAEVQIGNLRVRARLNDLARPSEVVTPEPVPAAPASRRRKMASQLAESETSGGVLYPSPGMELDLRGQRAEDALDALDRYIESAFLAGLPFVRIIHGKGTGRLRQVIREALQANAHVKRWENGHEKEGGDGVTVAHLHND
jgi:DNA mismatch repair protein MutS2